MMHFYKKQNNGFTLVETLVAISILLLVITGPMVISMRTAKSTSFSSEQVQAFFLAQEGLELAQKIRDDLILRSFLSNSNPDYLGNPWATFTSASGVYQDCFTATGCGLVWSSISSPQDCAVTDACLLYLADSGRVRFTNVQTGNTVTPFTRKIYFEDIGGGGVRARSEVTWRTGSLLATQKVTTDTYLYNIYDKP